MLSSSEISGLAFRQDKDSNPPAVHLAPVKVFTYIYKHSSLHDKLRYCCAVQSASRLWALSALLSLDELPSVEARLFNEEDNQD